MCILFYIYYLKSFSSFAVYALVKQTVCMYLYMQGVRNKITHRKTGGGWGQPEKKSHVFKYRNSFRVINWNEWATKHMESAIGWTQQAINIRSIERSRVSERQSRARQVGDDALCHMPRIVSPLATCLALLADSTSFYRSGINCLSYSTHSIFHVLFYLLKHFN